MLYYYVIIIKIKSLTTPISGQSTITNVCTKPLMVASSLDILLPPQRKTKKQSDHVRLMLTSVQPYANLSVTYYS